MSLREIAQIVEDYLKSVSRVLPSGFETEDMLEELEIHINEAFQNKVQERPLANKIDLLREVLNDLGEPKEIADEFKRAGVFLQGQEEDDRRTFWLVVRFAINMVIAVVAAWFVSTLPDAGVSFYWALVVFLVFGLAEWFMRAWQIRKADRIDVQS
ncbi:MAG: HAAS signaling domain-containing protein [Candidatus Thorarchaeota archaeon]